MSEVNEEITDLLLKIMKWRTDLSSFFQEMTGLTPRPFQKEFFDEVAKLKSKNIVIVAGRGIGKTLSLAIVALWYALVLPITENRPFKVVILAGSLKQAKICFNYILETINNFPYALRQLAKDPTQQEIVFKDGSWICPLPASEKSIRGYHPDLLIMDEAAKVDDEIVFAALPMTAPSPYSRHIFSSTPAMGQSFIEDKWNHRDKYQYPEWKFFNWNAETYLPKDHIETLKSMLPEDVYRKEIQGLPYDRIGKVFRVTDLKFCERKGIKENKELEKYAGVDWGTYPAPTVIVVVQKNQEDWEVLYTQEWLGKYSEDVLDGIEEICKNYDVRTIYTDSTDKGENLRLAARGLPVTPISFKGEKSIMLANLRTLIEHHRLKFDPHDLSVQKLIGQLIDYTYNSKRNDDYVDALMLAVHAQPFTTSSYDLTEILKAGLIKRSKEVIDEERKREIGVKLKRIRRL